MGALLDAPDTSSPLSMWSVAAYDMRCVHLHSMGADIRATPCRLRDLVLSVSEHRLSTSPFFGERRPTVKDACRALAEVTLANPDATDLLSILANGRSILAHRVIHIPPMGQ